MMGNLWTVQTLITTITTTTTRRNEEDRSQEVAREIHDQKAGRDRLIDIQRRRRERDQEVAHRSRIMKEKIVKGENFSHDNLIIQINLTLFSCFFCQSQKIQQEISKTRLSRQVAWALFKWKSTTRLRSRRQRTWKIFRQRLLQQTFIIAKWKSTSSQVQEIGHLQTLTYFNQWEKPMRKFN